MSRPIAFVTIAALAAAAACGGSSNPAPEPAPAPPAAVAAPTTIALPDTVAFPEGVAYDAAANALYTASAQDGTVVRVDAASGASQIITPAGTLLPAGSTTFPGPLGMTVDGNRLWIAGGFTGKMWAVSTTDGAVLKEATVPTAPRSLINDVVVVGSAAYFTDTFVPTLWRISLQGGAIGEPEPWLDLQGTAIDYAGDGPKLNGITATADGQSLVVVHMGQGRLFKIDIASKAIAAIDTAGEDLTGADGLVLDGHTLYVVRQTANQIATLTTAHDLSSATVVARFSDGLAWPATAARVGDNLVVVNTQFNTREGNTTTRPFTLLRVPVARLAQ
jgi:Cu-Zn family superoxide dismutase